jgi:hypothetical protein
MLYHLHHNRQNAACIFLVLDGIFNPDGLLLSMSFIKKNGSVQINLVADEKKSFLDGGITALY